MDTEHIHLKIEDHVALVTLDRAPVNAMNQRAYEELTWVFDALSDQEEVRCVVLTGSGKVFCAGADIRAAADRTGAPGEHRQQSRGARAAFYGVMECSKPVIAALNGPALGAGLAIAASCDILVASEEGCLGLPEVNVGMLGGSRHAMRLFSHSKVRRMMLTGQRIFGPELYRLGVVEECLPAEKLMDNVMQLAGEIASKSPIATRLAKHALNSIEFMTIRDGYRFEQNLTGELAKFEDSKEAKLAFLEKRQPVFKGR